MGRKIIVVITKTSTNTIIPAKNNETDGDLSLRVIIVKVSGKRILAIVLNPVVNNVAFLDIICFLKAFPNSNNMKANAKITTEQMPKAIGSEQLNTPESEWLL